MGYGVRGRLKEMGETIIYEYSPFNLNYPKFKNTQNIYDGLVIIKKSALKEPEIHSKIKGRKTIVKRIPVNVDYDTLINEGSVKIINSSFCWYMDSGGIDAMGKRIVWRVFDHYQKFGNVPSVINIYC